MIKTLAVKSLNSESDLWSSSQQFLNLEIHLASCVSPMPINHMPEPNTYCPLSNHTSKMTGRGNANEDAFHIFSSFILMLKRVKNESYAKLVFKLLNGEIAILQLMCFQIDNRKFKLYLLNTYNIHGMFQAN